MESVLVRWLVLVFLGLVSLAEGRLTNVTFTNVRAQYILQSPNFPNNAPPSTNHIWEITSPAGSRVGLVCDDIRIIKRLGCTEGSLTIWDGLMQINLCNVLTTFQRNSVNNKMFVQFRSGWFGVGRFRCVAHVIQANIGQGILDDSREHGQGVGPRATSCPCGWTNRQRIVGGRETQVNEYVFPVNIKYPTDRQGFCGGSILTRRHILTAAHCVFGNTRQLQVVVGEHDFRTSLETNATDVIDVAQTIMHERYDNDDMTNDIAILVLNRDITFSQLVGPVCLANERYNLLNRFIKVLGWGMTSTNGRFSDVLMKVDLQVIDIRRCAARYANTIDTRNPNQICTFAERRDSCQGDSGGPLIWHDPELNRYVQVALVSYGRDCASEDPAVNIDVAAYYDWIQGVVARYRPTVATCEKI